MGYVDIYAAAVPKANREAYLAHAKIAGAVFKRHGALEDVECWGEDVPDGDVTSFPMAVKRGPDEDVVAGWVVWPSKDARDTGMAAGMTDPEMRSEDMPFDGKRLIFGGFERVLTL